MVMEGEGRGSTDAMRTPDLGGSTPDFEFQKEFLELVTSQGNTSSATMNLRLANNFYFLHGRWSHEALAS